MSSLHAWRVKLTSFSVRLNGRSVGVLVFLEDILFVCGGWMDIDVVWRMYGARSRDGGGWVDGVKPGENDASVCMQLEIQVNDRQREVACRLKLHAKKPSGSC